MNFPIPKYAQAQTTMHARPDGYQTTDVQTPHSDDSDSLHQATNNRGDDTVNLGDDFEYSDDSDSLRQAADNRGDDTVNLGDDFEYSDDSDSDILLPQRWTTADSSLASRALDLIFKAGLGPLERNSIYPCWDFMPQLNNLKHEIAAFTWNVKTNPFLLDPRDSCLGAFPPTTEHGRVMKTEELMRMKCEFLDGFDASLREQTPPDIHLRPCYGPPLPAHKAVLYARSTILVHPPPTFDAQLMRKYWSLGASSCETEIVNLPISREELEALLDFLYHGSLDPERTEKHIAVLFFSAWNFDILYLSEFCAHHILSSLKPSNALNAFKNAVGCSHRALLEAVLDFIVENMEEIAFSKEYKQFVRAFPNHSVRITQAFFMYGSNKRIKT
ncbi:hypothetical protein WN944_018654 [Citrus x changshan-huyou]